MEGCPKVLMISYDTKEPGGADFNAPIASYIQDFYHENPDAYKNEIQQINQLKKNITNVTRDNQGCSAYRKYYAQLQFLQSRFPMSLGGAAALPFVWYDVYTGDPVTQKDIRFEQACILFNLGGLYSQLGANESRTSDESMKVACTYFQCAAGAFQYLKENFSLDSFPDMGGDVLALKSTIMLCQAQECLLEKSIRDNRKNTLVARISIQIKDYYQDAVKLLEGSGTSEMGSQLRKSWTKHLQMKINIYTAIAYIYMSNEADADKKFGEKVAYLKAASERMNEAMKITKNQPEQILETLRFLQDVVGNKLDAAVKENDFVYHALVPEIDKLPEIKGVSLVKAMPFQYNDASVSGPDIFQRLIPMRAHEASSLYSEEKAGLLRKITSEIQDKDLHLSESLSSMHIDDLMNPVEESIPENLSKKCKELRDVDKIVSTTEDQIKELAMLSEDFEVVFNEIASVLKNEEEFERDAKLGDTDRGTSKELEDLKKEFAQCIEVNEQARNTNMTLCNHFEESKEIVELLCGPDVGILATLPSQNFIDAPIDEPVVQRIRELLAAVEKMRSQRAVVEKKFREQLNKDDITSLLVIKEDGNQDNFFKDQLKKHDEMVAIIRQNLSAQDNILLQLTEENAKYAPTRIAAVEIAAKRDAQVQSYINHATLFQEVRERLVRGLKFYRDLKETLKVLEKKVADFCRRREKDKEKFRELKKKEGPPPRPTAAKPTFDRAAKPSGGHPVPAATQDSNFAPHLQTYQIPPNPGNFQRPQSPNMPPVGPYQNMPPGAARPQVVPVARMMAPGTVPITDISRVNIPTMPVSQPELMQPRVPGTMSGANVLQRFNVRAPLDSVPSMFPPGPQNDEFRPRFPLDTGLPPNQARFSTSGPLPTLQPNPAFQQPSSTNFSRPHFVQPSQNQPLPRPGLPLQARMPQQMQPMQHPHGQARQPFSNDVSQMRRGSSEQGQLPFPTEQHGQPPRPMLQPQGSRSSDLQPLQPMRFPGLDQRTLPPLERPTFGGQPQINRPPDPNMMMPRNEFRTPLQPVHNLDQARGQFNMQQPQQQRLPAAAQPLPAAAHQPSGFQYRPRTPQQVMPQDTRFAFEMQNQMQGPQRGSSQILGQRFGGYPDGFISSAQPTHGQGALFSRPISSVQQFVPGQVSPDDRLRFPAMQQQQQGPGTGPLRLPEPLLPERVATRQNLMDAEDHIAINKIISLQPMPAGNYVRPALFPEKQPDQQDPMRGGELQPPVEPMGSAIVSSRVGPQSQHVVSESKEHCPPAARPAHNQVPGGFVQRQLSDQSIVQPRNQYAFQGPMSSPAPERSQPSSFQPEPEPLAFQQRPVVTQVVSALEGLGALPTAPPLAISSQNVGTYNQPPPFSPSRPFDLITMNNRPVMATSRTSDSVVAGILGNTQSEKNPQDMMQVGFQQFQMQQMILQQQQLISMIQNQQSQQKATETMQIEKLQQQILDQQRVIEQLANEQHRWLEQQQQQSAHPSQEKSQEYMQMQLRQQELQMFEQHEQLLQQKALLMRLQNGMDVPPKGGSDASKQSADTPGLQASAVRPSLDRSSNDKAIKSESKPNQRPVSQSAQGDSSSRGGTVVDSAQAFGEGNRMPSLTTMTTSKVDSDKPSDMRSLASSVLSAFDVSLSAVSTPNTPVETTAKDSTSMTIASLDMLKDPVCSDNNSRASDNTQSTNQLLDFDISQFEEEMHAVLSGSQENLLKTPTRKASNIGDDTEQLGRDVSLKATEGNSLEDARWRSGEMRMGVVIKQGEGSAKSENSPPFYEPMLDAEQKLKHIGGQGAAGRPSEKGAAEAPATESQEKLGDKIDNATNELEKKDSLVIPPDTKQSVEDSEDVAQTDVTTKSGEAGTKEDEEKSAAAKEQHATSINDMPPVLAQSDSSVRKSSDAVSSVPDSREQRIDVPNNSEIPSIGNAQVDDAASTSPRPQLSRQLGRLSFYQAIETAEERRLYLEDLDEAVAQMHQKCMDLCKRIPGSSVDGFSKLWNDLAQVEELDSCSYTAEAGKKNVSKNRYRDILPWDHTRVLLKSLPNDYINANRINNLTQYSPDYIASQGPIPQCFEDFWTMVWEQRCPVIVMLTNEVEGTKLKCHPYWPRKLEQTTDYGALSIYLSEQEAGPSWKRRTFVVSHRETNEARKVEQLQFTSWPDYGIPDTPYDLLAFNEEVRKCHHTADPTVVTPLLLHCSAGVGRTGTFACIYSAIEEIVGGNGLVDVPGLVRKLRQCRFHMVQKKEQLVFCYQAILCYAQQFLAEEQISEDKSDDSSDDTKLSEQQGGPYEFLEGGSSPMDSVEQLLNLPVETGEPGSSGPNQQSDFSISNQTDGLLAIRDLDGLAATESPGGSQMKGMLTIDVTEARRDSGIGAPGIYQSIEDIVDASRERADSIPKFKVKSDIFAHKSPPLSPDVGPVSSDDKA